MNRKIFAALPDNAFEVKHYRIVTVQKIFMFVLVKTTLYSVHALYRKESKLIYPLRMLACFVKGNDCFHKET